MDTCFGQNKDNYHYQTQIRIKYLIGFEEFWRDHIAKAMSLLSTVCEKSVAKKTIV